LQLSFIPGAPGADIALALRRRALAEGKDAHFTVGLANEHLGAIISRGQYADPDYLPARAWLGPDAETWILAQAALDGEGDGSIAPRSYPEANVQSINGGISVAFS